MNDNPTPCEETAPSEPLQPLQLRRWFGHAHSVAGRSHDRTGAPCQDASRYFDSPDIAIAVIADGAGSRHHSQLGAQLAADCTMQWLQALTVEDILTCDEHLLTRVIHDVVHSQIRQAALEAGHAPDDYACTLGFVVACEKRFIAANLGDGLIFGVGRQQIDLLATQDRGEFANVTWFLTSPGSHARWSIRTGDPETYSGFVLCTDGVGDTLWHRPTGRFAPALAQIVGWFSQTSATEVRDSINQTFLPMARQRTTDDCTIALICRTVFTLEQINGFALVRQAEYLGIRSGTGLRNRLRVARHLQTATASEPADEHFPSDTGMTARTAERHAEYLRRMMRAND